MKKIFLLFAVFVTASRIYAQESLTDPRDGRVYKTAEIGDVTWMAEDLKFETATSHCPNFAESLEECSKANFYSYLELKQLCPEGWRLPTVEEWDQFVATFEDAETARLMEEKEELYRVDFLNKFNVFDRNVLNIVPVGRTEGNKWDNVYSADYWTVNNAISDTRFHMHISPYSVVGHAHKHHVSEKNEKKNRKFAVRCVCEKKAE